MRRAIAVVTAAPLLLACGDNEPTSPETVTVTPEPVTETITAAPSPTTPASDWEVFYNPNQIRDYLVATGIECPNNFAEPQVDGADRLECDDEHDIRIRNYRHSEDARETFGPRGAEYHRDQALDEGRYIIWGGTWMLDTVDEDMAREIYAALDENGDPITSAENAP